MSEEVTTENSNDEYEEIASEEVDRIVESLEQLAESTNSENIRTYLEEAINSVYGLVYDDEEGEDLEASEDEEMEIDESYEDDMLDEAA